MRLKDNWKPKVERITRGEIKGTFFPGTDVDGLLDDETLLLRGRVIDAMVHVGPAGRVVSCRLVGVPAPDKERSRARPTERSHPQSLARAMSFSAQKIAGAVELSGAPSTSEWQWIADPLLHFGQDSNWRRAPSILDQIRGWKTHPGCPRRDRLASPTTRSASPTVELVN